MSSEIIGSTTGSAKETDDLEEWENYIGSIYDYPEDLIDNEYIMTGYRIGFKGIKNGLRTLFMAHNETVNVWTHLLGKVFFLCVLIFIAWAYPSMASAGKPLQLKLSEQM